MLDLRESRANNQFTALLTSTRMIGTRIFVMGGNMKAGHRAFSSLRRSLLNERSAVVRMVGILMNWSSLGGPEVSLGVLVTL